MPNIFGCIVVLELLNVHIVKQNKDIITAVIHIAKMHCFAKVPQNKHLSFIKNWKRGMIFLRFTMEKCENKYTSRHWPLWKHWSLINALNENIIFVRRDNPMKIFMIEAYKNLTALDHVTNILLKINVEFGPDEFESASAEKLLPLSLEEGLHLVALCTELSPVAI